MRRAAFISLFAAAAALAACAHPAQPVEGSGMEWSLNQAEGEGAKLAFGTPYSDNVVLMMSCQPRSGQVTVSASGAPGASPRELRLISGKRTSRVPATATPSMVGDGSILEGSTSASDPVLTHFARSGHLIMAVGGRRTALPPADGAAARFVETCRPA